MLASAFDKNVVFSVYVLLITIALLAVEALIFVESMEQHKHNANVRKVNFFIVYFLFKMIEMI
jgi:hypothetical protein